jgi:hypothetical protein
MLTGRAVVKMRSQKTVNQRTMNDLERSRVECVTYRRNIMTEKSMDQKAASGIQSNADKTGNNQDFKSRAQSAADKNKK